ncbi:hypothetical protein ECNC101_09359 [Escherichia coli NC101]|nr:hypothetical protein ECNC101_09359 [Escherichia coli NC101]
MKTNNLIKFKENKSRIEIIVFPPLEMINLFYFMFCIDNRRF